MSKFKHDCPHCTSLGEFNGHDLYHCRQIGIPTVIARYGDEGKEYTSGMGLADGVPELTEAKTRAIKAGLPVLRV